MIRVFLAAASLQGALTFTLHAAPSRQSSSFSRRAAVAGPVKVDLDVYNLPLEQIAEEWTAKLVPETDFTEEGIYLAAKSDKEIFVDSLPIAFSRRKNEGLGIELLEIAGGREDGLGITVVSGIVEGGSADGSGLQVGDSISKVAIRKKGIMDEDGLVDFEEITAIGTECLGYDATVEAIGSLPPMEVDGEIVFLTVKRLRRKPKVKLNLQYPPSQNEPDITIELFSGENLRRAMLTRGVKLNDPLSKRFDSGGSGDCGAEGSCCTCAVSVVRGAELLNDAKPQEKQMLAETPRWRLACRAIVGHGMTEGEMTIRVNPRQW
jgi:ferredoxin